MIYQTFKTDSVKAVSIASLEFGRKVAQAIVIHPDYSYAAIDEKRYQKYVIKVTAREKNAHKFFHKGMIYKKFFLDKEHGTYADSLEQSV